MTSVLDIPLYMEGVIFLAGIVAGAWLNHWTEQRKRNRQARRINVNASNLEPDHTLEIELKGDTTYKITIRTNRSTP